MKCVCPKCSSRICLSTVFVKLVCEKRLPRVSDGQVKHVVSVVVSSYADIAFPEYTTWRTAGRSSWFLPGGNFQPKTVYHFGKCHERTRAHAYDGLL